MTAWLLWALLVLIFILRKSFDLRSILQLLLLIPFILFFSNWFSAEPMSEFVGKEVYLIYGWLYFSFFHDSQRKKQSALILVFPAMTLFVLTIQSQLFGSFSLSGGDLFSTNLAINPLFAVIPSYIVVIWALLFFDALLEIDSLQNLINAYALVLMKEALLFSELMTPFNKIIIFCTALALYMSLILLNKRKFSINVVFISAAFLVNIQLAIIPLAVHLFLKGAYWLREKYEYYFKIYYPLLLSASLGLAGVFFYDLNQTVIMKLIMTSLVSVAALKIIFSLKNERKQ